jgi:thiol-disulfide isomerase/thioredoxin
MNTYKISAGLLAIVTLVPSGAVFAQDGDAMMKKDDMMTKTEMSKEGTTMKEKVMEKKMTKKEKMKMKKEMMKKKMMEKKEMMMKEQQMKKETMSGDAMMKKGSYMTVATPDVMSKLSMTDKNILFFHASWCPACKSADSDIMKMGVKMGYNIIRVNYDDSTDLKKKYGVTTQHTFVQVDGKGEMITSWRGGSAEEIYKNTK